MGNWSFDLGIHCGWARFNASGEWLEAFGTHYTGCSSKCKRCREAGARRETHEVEIERFFARHQEWSRESDGVSTWAYERVRRHKGVDAAHVHGGIRYSLVRNALLCDAHPRPIEVSSWKKHCGVKGQSKEAYIARINELTGLNLQLEDEDTAAAVGAGLAAFCPTLADFKGVRK